MEIGAPGFEPVITACRGVRSRPGRAFRRNRSGLPRRSRRAPSDQRARRQHVAKRRTRFCSTDGVEPGPVQAVSRSRRNGRLGFSGVSDDPCHDCREVSALGEDRSALDDLAAGSMRTRQPRDQSPNCVVVRCFKLCRCRQELLPSRWYYPTPLASRDSAPDLKRNDWRHSDPACPPSLVPRRAARTSALLCSLGPELLAAGPAPLSLVRRERKNDRVPLGSVTRLAT